MDEIRDKNNKLLKLTEAQEKEFRKRIQDEYQAAYIAIKKELAYLDMKGVLARTELYKYGRFESLQKQLYAELEAIEALSDKEFSAYLDGQYQLNYFYEGFIAETAYQVQLNYAMSDVSKFKNTVLTPLSKIALQNNAEAVKAKMRTSITQSIAQGEGVGELSKRLKFDLETNANNALRIASTETTRVMNEAKQDSYKHIKEQGLPVKKQWMSTLDLSTRKSHRSLDGQRRDLDKPFSNGLMFPGDQNGSPGESINCRCTMIEVIEGYENAVEFRRARNTNGSNAIITYQNYDEWYKNSVFK